MLDVRFSSRTTSDSGGRGASIWMRCAVSGGTGPRATFVGAALAGLGVGVAAALGAAFGAIDCGAFFEVGLPDAFAGALPAADAAGFTADLTEAFTGDFLAGFTVANFVGLPAAFFAAFAGDLAAGFAEAFAEGWVARALDDVFPLVEVALPLPGMGDWRCGRPSRCALPTTAFLVTLSLRPISLVEAPVAQSSASFSVRFVVHSSVIFLCTIRRIRPAKRHLLY